MLLAVFISLLAGAQNFNISFRHLNLDEMLPENHIKCFYKDSVGFMWLGTRNGLVRFDGMNIKTFQNIPGDTSGFKGYNVNGILKDKDGNLWIGTDYGVNFYDVKKNTFQNFPLIPDETHNQTGMCYSVPLAIDENGQLWIFISTRYALYIFDTHTHQLKPVPCKADLDFGVAAASAPGKINRLGFRLLQGVVLYGIDNYNAVNGQEYFAPGGKFPELVINEARVYFDGSDSIAWITCDKGLIKLNYKAGNYILYNSFNGKAVGKTTDVCFYKNQMFVASAYNGLFVFDMQKQAFTGLVENNSYGPGSLQSNRLSKVFITGNTIFVAFESGGLDFANLQTIFTHYISKQDVTQLGIKNQITGVCQFNNGTAWLGTSANGLLVFNTATGSINVNQSAQLAKQLPAKQVNNIATNNTYTAISSNEGLFVFKNNSTAGASISPVMQGSINYTAFFNDTVLLATTNDGLYQINITAKGLMVKPVADYNNEHNFKSLSIYTIKARHLVYVMAEYGTYLHELEFKNNTFHITRATWLTQDNSFITQGNSDDELLLCGPHGIIIFNTTSFSFSSIDGKIFSNHEVSAVLKLGNGNWFVAYNNGAAIYDASFTGLVNSFDQAQGLYSTSFFPNACQLLFNGDVLLGTNDGVFMYPSEDNAVAATLPPVYFSDIKVNDIPYSFNNEVNYIGNVRLRYNENTVSFSFSTVDFALTPNKKLEYKMEGVDHDWVPASRNGFARYANLLPGNYTFTVRNYGDNSDTGIKQLTVVIGRPFWKEWWFVFSCIVLLAGLGYGIYQYRIQEFIRLQKIRNDIATGLHDDIGSTLTNISILAELSSASIRNYDKASEFIKRISAEVAVTSESLDDIVWSINTSNDSFHELAARMRRYATELFEGEGVEWDLLFDENLSDKKLKMDLRRDMYLVFKEAVNNVHKHAEASHIKISLRLKRGKMVMVIQDDGEGFDITSDSGNNGLIKMRVRVEKWKGRLSIASDVSGTLITVIVPLASASRK